MNVAFVYAGGRESRWQGAKLGTSPREFFYGAAELALGGDRVRVMDVPQPLEGPAIAVLDAVVGRLLPARTNAASLIQVLRILPGLRHFDCIVATYPQAALVLGLCRKAGLLRVPLVGIQCGLVNHPIRGLRKRLTQCSLQTARTVLFAESECSEMRRRFELDETEVVSGDFGVDMDFWTPGQSVRREKFILAVGNDSRRDYQTLLAAAEKVGAEFRIVTRMPLPERLPANVRRLEGDWKGALLSDEALRDLYRRAEKVVVPLRESIQPSGQSVAMQAIACGAPVIMTRTSGCWTGSVLRDGITLVPEGDADALAAAILQSGGLEQADETRQRLLDAGWDGAGFARRLREVCLCAIGSRNRAETPLPI